MVEQRNKTGSTEEVASNLKGQEKKINLSYAYFALAIIFFVRVVVNWQGKSLGYFFGFSGVGELSNPTYEIGKAYP